MKKLFTIDDIAVAFVSALGYGFGEIFSSLMGWPPLVCALASMVLGVVIEEIITKIAFSEAVQKNPVNRIITYAVFCLVFLAVHIASVMRLGVSMFDYLVQQFLYVVGLPIFGFVVNLLIRYYRVRKIRELYGDGSEGYVFDVNKEDIEEINRQNQPVRGEYDTDCAVKTRTGIYVGEKDKKALVFLGIPYAKPPVGERRWKAPEPLPASEAVMEAKNFGASAIQVDHGGSIIKEHRQSEDCLTLNVCVGMQKTETLKPVLVLFHHGDFTCGGVVDPLLYGNEFVNTNPDVVFVSFNYRLGIFGFIDFSEIPGGEAYPDAINLGLLDQIAALEWIRENIGAFGGDAGQVTVMGFESGATSICLLSASERAKGLFRKAFVFNGCPETVYNTPESARALAKELIRETHAATMEELLLLNTETLKNAAQKLWRNMCAPTCDGTLIPVDIYQSWRNGAASDIRFVIGIPGNESQVYRSLVGGRKFDVFLAVEMAGMQNGPDGLSPSAGPEEKANLINLCIAVSNYRSAEILAESGNQVHVLYWDEKPLIGNLGSGTMDAVAALLGNSEAGQMYGNVIDADLSETLQGLLMKFIRGEALELYPNEIRGVDGFRWKAFPLVLIVSEGKIHCGTVKERLTEETD